MMMGLGLIGKKGCGLARLNKQNPSDQSIRIIADHLAKDLAMGTYQDFLQC